MGSPVEFIGDQGCSWKDSETLSGYVIRMYLEKKTDTDDFKKFLAYFGRDRCRQIVREYLEAQKALNDALGPFQEE